MTDIEPLDLDRIRVDIEYASAGIDAGYAGYGSTAVTAALELLAEVERLRAEKAGKSFTPENDCDCACHHCPDCGDGACDECPDGRCRNKPRATGETA